ncbi:pyruvate/oxaloacetate carboxyltransferase [Nesterenkonia sp. DZ6]|nr:pyruvate/oxaloacetate carboxyltransferase [Nesterenkonia sp. DZ6]MCH8560331.1 pyruvate/oxaloacetate carboxyltransferase [Nesterenkonia sp. DZ6]
MSATQTQPADTVRNGRGPVRFVDTSLRDGNQSLWGAIGLTTGMVEALGQAIDRAGYHALDFTSSTNLSMGVKFHQENPWERISRMRAVTPDTQLSAITPGMRFMSWEKSPETVMRMALRLMARHGVRRLQVADPMNDADAVERVSRWAKEEGINHVVAALTFTDSPVHTDDSYTENLDRFVADGNIDAVYLKDPGGLLTVERTRSLIPKLRAGAGDTTLELHSHCTTGTASELYVVAAELGVDVLHTGLGPLSNGTAQPSIEQLVKNLDAVGIDYALDLDAVKEAAEILREIASSQGLEPGRPTEFDLSPHQHQVPGGMMSTLKRQLDEIKMVDALPEVIDEVKAVRREIGYPIMVTPFSQFVGSQSLLNVMAVRNGQERYSRIPDEVMHFVLGHYGTPAGAIAPEVAAKVEASSRAAQLSAEPTPVTVDELQAEYAERLGRSMDEEELLLRVVLPSEQVEAMRAAGPAPTWSPGGVDAPVTNPAQFIKAVQDLPGWRHLAVHKNGQRVELQRTSEPPTGAPQ